MIRRQALVDSIFGSPVKKQVFGSRQVRGVTKSNGGITTSISSFSSTLFQGSANGANGIAEVCNGILMAYKTKIMLENPTTTSIQNGAI